MEKVRLSVGDFVALTNQTLEYAYPSVEVEGEVQGFKVNQGKYVFFDLKDSVASVGCFMTVWHLRTPLEDGMKVVVVAQPKLTQWGKFSLTVKQVSLVGEGTIRRSFDMLVAKLNKEGLFDESRKRPLPHLPAHIGVISSVQAAGYADFIKILDERWGGLRIDVAQVQVQGNNAPNHIIKALTYFNESPNPPEVIAIIRGGGSIDDLSAFNDEPLARAIASSRVPIITGVGHETDTSLADMIADRRAATPTNAAQMLVPDKREIKAELGYRLEQALALITQQAQAKQLSLDHGVERIGQRLETKLQLFEAEFNTLRVALKQLNPETVLKRGYAIVKTSAHQLITEKVKVGESLSIEIKNAIIKAGVTEINAKAKR